MKKLLSLLLIIAIGAISYGCQAVDADITTADDSSAEGSASDTTDETSTDDPELYQWIISISINRDYYDSYMKEHDVAPQNLDYIISNIEFFDYENILRVPE